VILLREGRDGLRRGSQAPDCSVAAVAFFVSYSLIHSHFTTMIVTT